MAPQEEPNPLMRKKKTPEELAREAEEAELDDFTSKLITLFFFSATRAPLFRFLMSDQRKKSTLFHYFTCCKYSILKAVAIRQVYFVVLFSMKLFFFFQFC